MPILSGLTSTVVDGTQYDAVGPGSFSLSTVERSAKVAYSGNVNYAEEPVAGTVSFDIYVTPGLDPSMFNDMVDVQVIVQLATDTTLIAYNAFVTDKVEFDAKEGTLKLAFASRNVTVMTS